MAVITQSGRRLLEFIYSMTSHAQLSTDSLVVQHQKVDVVPLAQDVAMLASHLLGSNVQLELDLSPVPLVVGDPGRIVQVRCPTCESSVQVQHCQIAFEGLNLKHT
jgi:signal transduction histidine kinase